MEKQERKSNWDDLARELGAEVHPDEPPPLTTSEAASESYSYQRSADKPRPAPRKPPANWSQLNVELGLPPVEEPAVPAAEPREMPVIEERLSPSPAAREPREQRPRDERRRHEQRRDERARENRPRRDREDAAGGERERERGREQQRARRREEGDSERGDRERGRDDGRRRGRRGRGGRARRERDSERGSEQHRDEPLESTYRESGRQQLEHCDDDERTYPEREREERAEHWGDTQATQFEAEEVREQLIEVERAPVDEAGDSEASAPASPVAEEPPKPSAGVSLWHKIFGSPAQQAAKIAEQVAESDHAEVAEQIAEAIPEREAAWTPSADEFPAAPPSVAELDAAEAESVGEAVDELEEGKFHGRSHRRRRGRGRRGRRGAERSDQADTREATRREQRGRMETGGPHEDDFDDLGVEQDELDDEPALSATNGFEGDQDSDFAEGESADRMAEGRGHRSIPSWDDAIGIIVDANLQARSQRPKSSQGGRRGRSSRGGRSRGPRGGNNPSNGQ